MQLSLDSIYFSTCVTFKHKWFVHFHITRQINLKPLNIHSKFYLETIQEIRHHINQKSINILHLYIHFTEIEAINTKM